MDTAVGIRDNAMFVVSVVEPIGHRGRTDV